MVFQRSLSNEALVTITGMAPAAATVIEARFVPLAVGQGTATAWTQINFLPGSSAFEGQVRVSAGWYRLDVRAMANNYVMAQTQVNRVGVGEVFVVAGQSNVYGHIQRVLPPTKIGYHAWILSRIASATSCCPFNLAILPTGVPLVPVSHPTCGVCWAINWWNG